MTPVSMNTINLFLVDDHAVLREGLKRLIDAEEDMHVVGEAWDGLQAVELILAARPHVVVLDISMPGLNGVEVTRRLKAACPEVKVLVLTVHEDKSYSRELLEAGALGYMLKRAAAEELVVAIRKVASGNIYVDARVTEDLVNSLFATPDPAGPVFEKLSERELTVLRLIAQGYSNKEIGGQIGVSVKTVETYKSRAMEKLHLRSRVDIVRHAHKQGWLHEGGLPKTPTN
jgi:DNA-binding NarL/FixJ family response regulator